MYHMRDGQASLTYHENVQRILSLPKVAESAEELQEAKRILLSVGIRMLLTGQMICTPTFELKELVL